MKIIPEQTTSLIQSSSLRVKVDTGAFCFCIGYVFSCHIHAPTWFSTFLVYKIYSKIKPSFEGFIYLICLTITFCKIIHKAN